MPNFGDSAVMWHMREPTSLKQGYTISLVEVADWKGMRCDVPVGEIKTLGHELTGEIIIEYIGGPPVKVGKAVSNRRYCIILLVYRTPPPPVNGHLTFSLKVHAYSRTTSD